MRLTRANVEELRSAMEDVTAAWEDLEEAVDTWTDEDAGREERADAREVLESDTGTLEAALDRAKVAVAR